MHIHSKKFYMDKKMKIILTILIAIIWTIQGQAQIDSSKVLVDYNFIIQDTPSQLFTMRQFNENYFSAYRLFARGLDELITIPVLSGIIQAVIVNVFLTPLTHEEGHRSILTAKNIGSISQPYFNSDGAAYVTGVSDATLQNLRDTDLPNYIRLHTAGLESDYTLTMRAETIGSLELDKFKNYRWEYWSRKLGILQYYLSGLMKSDVDIEEETDELKRDIVGHDLYGAARHLHRSGMEFYRYTQYDDLTDTEKKFVNRMGYRSLLNLLNPIIIGKSNFKLSEVLKVNFGLGYTAAPFGDFIDEHFWVKFKDYINLYFYARQFQNKSNWFPGFGISLIDFRIIDRLSTRISVHFWQQPKNFNFYASKSFTGGAIDLSTRLYFLKRSNYWLKGMAFESGFIYKTKGYLPEELYLEEYFGIRMGFSVLL
jgi:hypothetical protein